jgi:hypothetical protein
MESNKQRYAAPLQRNLANLKLVSRLLGHELHSQGSAKSVSLTREEVQEIQTTIDLFIEEATRTVGGAAPSAAVMDTQLVPARN